VLQHRLPFALLSLTLLLMACDTPSKSAVTETTFGSIADGSLAISNVATLYTLRNENGMEVAISDYGGIVQKLTAANRDGEYEDVVLGFDSVAEYAADSPYFGAIIGRYGNRIGSGRFTLDGHDYQLATNNGKNHLHGGDKGFDKVMWQASVLPDATNVLILKYRSVDGEEGYPGELDVRVTYSLSGDDELRIDYSATSSKNTPVNLTNHSYFNLAGQGHGDILGHVVEIFADSFTPVDDALIPSGEIRDLTATPMDFRSPASIGARIGASDEQLEFGLGYDHNWILRDNAGELRLVARVHEPTSGRVMEVLTTEPGLQFYTGNFLDGSLRGKNGSVYQHRGGFCMETQHYPDSPNRPEFPNTILPPGKLYQSTTVYRFSAR
jgi:aldose 1-epimerase